MKIFGNKKEAAHRPAEQDAGNAWAGLKDAPNDKFNNAINAMRQQNRAQAQPIRVNITPATPKNAPENPTPKITPENPAPISSSPNSTPDTGKDASKDTIDAPDQLPEGFREKLLTVKTPVDELQSLYPSFSPAQLANSLIPTLDGPDGRQQRRLLSVFGDPQTTIDDEGLVQFAAHRFNNPRPTGQDIVDFLDKYPTPMDFEPIVGSFISRQLKNTNGTKHAEYRESARQFMNFIYGDRFQAYEMQKMMAVNDRRRQKTMEAIKKAREQMTPERLAEHERDRHFGVVNFSRSEIDTYREQYGANRPGPFLSGVRGAEALPQRFERSDYGGDSYFADYKKQIFGVFDGANGHGGAREASSTAAKSIEKYSNEYILQTPDDLRYVLDRASEDVHNNPAAGITTGALAQIVTDADGNKFLNYAAIGDSRIYVIRHGEDDAYLLTKDEAIGGNRLTNSMGGQDFGAPARVLAGNYGQIAVKPGDRILICSDGITGDRPDQAIDDWLGHVINAAPSPRVAAEAVAAIARKDDDRTAIVTEVM